MLFVRLSVIGVVSCLAGTAVSAQTSSASRPYRGLFASGPADATQTLSVSGSIAGGYDTSILADLRGGNSVGEASEPGVVTNASAGLLYSLQGDAFTLSASTGTSIRYYPSLGSQTISGLQGGLSFTVPLGRKASFSAGASAAHQPYSYAALFPVPAEGRVVEAPTPDLDTAASPTSYLSYQGNAGMSYQLTSRTSLSGGINYRAAESGLADLGDFTRRSAGAGISHSIGRGLAVRLGYSYGIARYGTSRTIETHGLDIGVDYNRALSISRHTTLSFSTGSTATSSAETRQFRFNGGARLHHEIGRSWNAWLAYGRQVLVHETWTEPVMADAMTAGLGGLITRRLQFSATAQGGLGTIGAAANAPGFDSLAGRATLSMAITRFMNLGVAYSYYHHRFDSHAVVPTNIRASMDRHSVSASVNLWAPLVTRGRRTNASR